MTFRLDAELRTLVHLLKAEGCDTLHTLDLPDGNRTLDQQISALADLEERVVSSTDANFVQSRLLQGNPRKLLVIATGNIRNPELASLMLQALPSQKDLFKTNSLIDLHRGALIVRQ